MGRLPVSAINLCDTLWSQAAEVDDHDRQGVLSVRDGDVRHYAGLDKVWDYRATFGYPVWSTLAVCMVSITKSFSIVAPGGSMTRRPSF